MNDSWVKAQLIRKVVGDVRDFYSEIQCEVIKF